MEPEIPAGASGQVSSTWPEETPRTYRIHPPARNRRLRRRRVTHDLRRRTVRLTKKSGVRKSSCNRNVPGRRFSHCRTSTVDGTRPPSWRSPAFPSGKQRLRTLSCGTPIPKASLRVKVGRCVNRTFPNLWAFDSRWWGPGEHPSCCIIHECMGGHVQRPRGRTIVNMLPAPGVLWTSILPPWASTMVLAMQRPRPAPPASRERAGSTR